MRKPLNSDATNSCCFNRWWFGQQPATPSFSTSPFSFLNLCALHHPFLFHPCLFDPSLVTASDATLCYVLPSHILYACHPAPPPPHLPRLHLPPLPSCPSSLLHCLRSLACADYHLRVSFQLQAEAGYLHDAGQAFGTYGDHQFGWLCDGVPTNLDLAQDIREWGTYMDLSDTCLGNTSWVMTVPKTTYAIKVSKREGRPCSILTLLSGDVSQRRHDWLCCARGSRWGSAFGSLREEHSCPGWEDHNLRQLPELPLRCRD